MVSMLTAEQARIEWTKQKEVDMPQIQTIERPVVHAKAVLEISGIPIPQDCEQLEKALHKHGTPVFKENISIKFNRIVNPERRVSLKLEGLSPALLSWFVAAITEALADCGHKRCDATIVVLRR